jgi:hypothetical protein
MESTDEILNRLVLMIIDGCIDTARNIWHEAQDTDFDLGYETFRKDIIHELSIQRAELRL